MKKILLLPLLFSFMFSQIENDKIQIQENSVYWKKGVDKLVLKDGEVKELGSHDELMTQKGVYYTLNQLQFQDVTQSSQH